MLARLASSVEKSACFCLLSTEVKGMHHHIQLSFFLKTGSHIAQDGLELLIIPPLVPKY